MTTLVWPNKDPGEILDYDLDWSQRLGSDTIVTSNWAIVTTDGALVINSNAHTGNTTKVWLSAGTLKQNYILQNTITTSDGDTEIQTVMLPVRAK